MALKAIPSLLFQGKIPSNIILAKNMRLLIAYITCYDGVKEIS